MAATTTPLALIQAAYLKSAKNMPDTIATDATELLGLVTRILRRYYAVAARIQWQAFGVKVVVSDTDMTGSWPFVESVESLARVELEDGTLVRIVPIDDRTLGAPEPSVYELGGALYPAGNANDPDPADTDLVFWYAKRPDDPATINDLVDALWAEQFNELVHYDIAAYLAVKDGRDDELQSLAAQRENWYALYTAWLEHRVQGGLKRFGNVPGVLAALELPVAPAQARVPNP